MVFPRLVASEHKHDFERGAASSGMPELDAMLGGGLDRGTSALLLGPPGTGKSALATQWASAAAGRGEKACIFAFDESVATMRGALDVAGHRPAPSTRRRDASIVQQIDPAEMPPGELAHQRPQAVEVDRRAWSSSTASTATCNAMPDEPFLVCSCTSC